MQSTSKKVTTAPRKRGRPSLDTPPHLIAEQALAYGIKVPTEPVSEERFLSPNDVAKIMNVTGMAVKQWIYRRRLPAVRLANGFWKIKVDDFEEFLKTRNDVHRRTVMLVECNDKLAGELSSSVEPLGCRALAANNYADAMLKSLEHFPSLIVVSLAENNPDCWKFIERVRNHKSLRRLPILLIAPKNPSDTEMEQAIRFGTQGFLVRPFDAQTLTSELERLIQ